VDPIILAAQVRSAVVKQEGNPVMQGVVQFLGIAVRTLAVPLSTIAQFLPMVVTSVLLTHHSFKSTALIQTPASIRSTAWAPSTILALIHAARISALKIQIVTDRVTSRVVITLARAT
jgi:hypothetical protein